jgi:site-specific recombinase XerD
MAHLPHGSGLRLMERVPLRVKDLDFDQRQIFVRDGNGAKDRIIVLADSANPAGLPRCVLRPQQGP